MIAIDQLQFGDVDLGNLRNSEVRAAFVLQMPFRFRVGAFLHFPLQWTDGDYEICVQNSLDIPTKEVWEGGAPVQTAPGTGIDFVRVLCYSTQGQCQSDLAAPLCHLPQEL